VSAIGNSWLHKIWVEAPPGKKSRFIGESEELISAAKNARLTDYSPERGAWLTLKITRWREGETTVLRDYEEEPDWRYFGDHHPSEEEYDRELEEFPRPGYAIPDWFRAHVTDAPAKPAPWAPTFRQAEAFDYFDQEKERYFTGWVDPLDNDEAAKVLAYLNGGTLALTARTLVPDEVDPDRGAVVPLEFRTDGTWIWPQACAYYLEQHGTPPQDNIVDHIRARDYIPPAAVGEETLTAVRTQLCEWIESRVTPQ
jgi:hypothetical protein